MIKKFSETRTNSRSVVYFEHVSHTRHWTYNIGAVDQCFHTTFRESSLLFWLQRGVLWRRETSL